MTILYHNENCSKSCAAEETLRGLDVDFETVEYLKTPPTAEELSRIIALLGVKPEELVRKNEPVFQEKFEGKPMTDREWIEAMVAFPVLIQRPIVIYNGKAVIGRTEGSVESLVANS